jgi:hypothetical protein
MLQGCESSGEIELFTGQPWLNRRLNSTLLAMEFRLQPVFDDKLKLELQPFSLASTKFFSQNFPAQA